MLTNQKRKVAKLVGRSRSMKEAMIKADYAQSTSEDHQERLSKDEEFMALLDKELSDNKVVKTHQEVLEATKPISARITNKDAGIDTQDFIEVPDWQARVKAVDLAYRVKGKLVERKELTGKAGGKIEIEITPGAVEDIPGQPQIQDSGGGTTLREDDFIAG